MYLKSQQNYAKASPFNQHNTFVNNLLASTTEVHKGAQFRDCAIYMLMTWSPTKKTLLGKVHEWYFL